MVLVHASSSCLPERREQGAEQGREPGAVPLGQILQQRALGVEEGGEGASTAARPSVVSRTMTPRRSSGSGYRSTYPRALRRSIRLVMVPLVTSVSRSRRPGDSSYGVPGTAQRGQHVELPLLDGVLGERLATGELQPARQPTDPAEDRDRGEVEVAALAAPGLEQLVHLVTHGRSLEPVENLDIKMKQRRHWMS